MQLWRLLVTGKQLPEKIFFLYDMKPFKARPLHDPLPIELALDI